MSLVSHMMRLPGPSIQVQNPPQACTTCGGKHLFCQADFNRTIGVVLVGIACVLTVLFAVYGNSWWLTWSPMLAFLLADRTFAAMSPDVVVCYECDNIHRGLSREDCRKYPAFDLNVHDRLMYAERTTPATVEKF